MCFQNFINAVTNGFIKQNIQFIMSIANQINCFEYNFNLNFKDFGDNYKKTLLSRKNKFIWKNSIFFIKTILFNNNLITIYNFYY